MDRNQYFDDNISVIMSQTVCYRVFLRDLSHKNYFEIWTAVCKILKISIQLYTIMEYMPSFQKPSFPIYQQGFWRNLAVKLKMGGGVGDSIQESWNFPTAFEISKFSKYPYIIQDLEQPWLHFFLCVSRTNHYVLQEPTRW